MPSGNFGEEKQDQLRTWYLARLRKKALEEAGAFNLTPAGLINADKHALENFIAERAAERLKTDESSPLLESRHSVSKHSMIILLGCLGVAIVAFSAFPILLPGRPMVCVAVTAILGFIIYAWCVQCDRLQQITNALANNNQFALASTERSAESLLSEVLFRSAKLVERERLIADYASEVLCSFSADCQLEAVSPSSFRSWGLHPAQLIGSNFWSLFNDYDRNQLLPAFWESKKRRDEQVAETKLRCADGNEIDVKWTVEWSETAATYFVTAQDISAAKRLERLRQEFFTVVSHDMRSPFANIITVLGLLERGRFGELNDEGKSRLNGIERTANYVIDLLNNLVDLERIESSSLQLDLTSVKLPDLIGQAIEAVSALAEQRKLTFDISAESATILVDEMRIKRVLINLLSNAIKFSPESGKISVVAKFAGNDCLISVSDQGRGISPADQSRLFNRFYQIEAEDASLRGGSGLGLHTCQAIARAHEGVIAVTSEIGKGSTFTLKLSNARKDDGNVPVSTPATKVGS